MSYDEKRRDEDIKKVLNFFEKIKSEEVRAQMETSDEFLEIKKLAQQVADSCWEKVNNNEVKEKILTNIMKNSEKIKKEALELVYSGKLTDEDIGNIEIEVDNEKMTLNELFQSEMQIPTLASCWYCVACITCATNVGIATVGALAEAAM